MTFECLSGTRGEQALSQEVYLQMLAKLTTEHLRFLSCEGDFNSLDM
jgi:hypothetical protein